MKPSEIIKKEVGSDTINLNNVYKWIYEIIAFLDEQEKPVECNHTRHWTEISTGGKLCMACGKVERENYNP